MKRSTFLLILLTLFSFSAFTQTSAVTVSGTVTAIETGEPIDGHGIFIVTDSLNGVGYFNMIFTGENGQYNDSFEVPEQSEGMVTVFTFDCEGQSTFQELMYGPENYELTADFAICTEFIPLECYADFWYYQMEDFSVEFQDFSWPEPSTWA